MPLRVLLPAAPRIVCALGLALGAAIATGAPAGRTPQDAIARWFANRGLVVSPADVVPVGRPAAFEGALVHQPVLVLAARPGRGRDVYYLEVRVSPGGRLLGARRATNLSRSPAADETKLVAQGSRAAFATRTEAGFEAVTLLDLGGEPASVTAGWSPLWRVAISLTRFQETGRVGGIGRTRYAIEPPVPDLDLDLDGTRPIVRGVTFARVSPTTRGQPGLLGWTVDTVRNHPWVGPERIERLEHAFFQMQDLGRRAYWGVRGDESAAEIEAELGIPAPEAATLDAPPPEIGFPPPATNTVFRSRMEGEGVWVPIEDDFARGQPGLGPVFYQTWLRADPERSFARVVLTVWDPRQVALGLRAGTQEPVGDTGQAGDGMIPRDPRLLRRVVAGFNGGFQAMHGEYGVMVDDQVLLPPKPWAATVAILTGGRIAFGTWPGDREDVPEEIDAFRQNMTVLVQDGTMDPYHRSWWGGAPPGSEDPAHTVRTAVCLTEEGFGVYAWGKSLSHETLGAALLAARCAYAVHLDMNSGHSGFEFYNVTPAAETPPLERALERNQEAEGEVRGAEGLHFRSRRMVRGMGHMRFPRYIGRDPRDFFFLALRAILPGDPLPLGRPPRSEGEGVFSVEGLPHVGFPYAVARTRVEPRPGAPVSVARFDPQRIALAPQAGAVPLVSITGGASGALALVAKPGAVGSVFTIEPAAAATGSVVLRGVALDGSAARAGVGIDPDGRLVWAEGPDAASVIEVLRMAEATAMLGLVAADPHLDFLSDGRVARLDGRSPVAPAPDAVSIYGVDRPIASRLFPDVAVVPPSVWYQPQAKRVRYFRVRDAGAGDADAGPPPAAD